MGVVLAFWSRGNLGDAKALKYLELGTSLLGYRDLAGAAIALRRATRSPDVRDVQQAYMMLGIVYTRQGKDRLASRAWRRAGKGDPAVALIASMLSVNAALDPRSLRDVDFSQLDAFAAPEQQQDSLEATGANIATARAHLEDTPESQTAADLIRRGAAASAAGNTRQARRFYQQAIDSGHPDHSPNAAELLGIMLRRNGDTDGAELAFRRAAASGHPEHAPFAALTLGIMLAERDDVAGAVAALQQCVDTGDADHAVKGALLLGHLQAAVRDVTGARTSCQYVVTHGSPEEARQARELLESLGRRP